MKKVGIITIYDNNNYGNRLQNFATQEKLKKLGLDCLTVKNDAYLNNRKCNNKDMFIYYLKCLKRIIKKNKRKHFFLQFNENIELSDKIFNWNKKELISKFDYICVGSDQVWNPNFDRLSKFELLDCDINNNRIAFAASFGISELPEQYKQKTADALKTFKAISVREDSGKKIVEELTGRTDVEVLVDPTMLLTPEEWDKVSKKPEQLNFDKYILCYFLGELSEQRKKEIERVAKENDCKIINILDKNDPFYKTGPSEFLYLEKNAFLICTDSFHSSVFAILFNRPFVVFNREDKNESMNSRIETLLSKFKLQNREFNGTTITYENINHDYNETYNILKEERKKSDIFLKKAFDIEKE